MPRLRPRRRHRRWHAADLPAAIGRTGGWRLAKVTAGSSMINRPGVRPFGVSLACHVSWAMSPGIEGVGAGGGDGGREFLVRGVRQPGSRGFRGLPSGLRVLASLEGRLAGCGTASEWPRPSGADNQNTIGQRYRGGRKRSPPGIVRPLLVVHHLQHSQDARYSIGRPGARAGLGALRSTSRPSEGSSHWRPLGPPHGRRRPAKPVRASKYQISAAASPEVAVRPTAPPGRPRHRRRHHRRNTRQAT